MLKDLSQLIDECRSKFDSFPFTSDIEIKPNFAEKLESSFQAIEPNSTFTIYPYSICLINDKGLRADLSSSSLWFGAAYWEFASALHEYKKIIELIKRKLKDSGYLSSELKVLLKLIPSNNWRTCPNQQLVSDFENEIDSYFGTSSTDKALFFRFIEERDWWIKPFLVTAQTNGKALDRSDVYQSAILLATKVIIANSDRLLLIIEAFSRFPSLRHAFEQAHKNEILLPSLDNTDISEIGINQIYYGAPGTGKSHRIEQLVNSGNSVRTVFHTDTQNSDFVGCLKPSMSDRGIEYSFRPGPFCLALQKASLDSSKSIYLVIEEINRAAAAAVFGETFQLLDRAANGRSQYSIDITDPDMQTYLEDHAPNVLEGGRLFIPANLSFLATMNSSDQAVMPMDSAFKRRWQFEYVSLESVEYPQGNFTISDPTEEIIVSWESLSKTINMLLSGQEHIPEDRLLGPWFVSTNELANPIEALAGKIVMYLWEDVLRHGGRDAIFNTDVYPTLYKLVNGIKSNENIFSDAFISELKNLLDVEVGE